MPIIIENDGPTIVSSNFWESSAARAGKVFLSTNAGAFRLLCPKRIDSVGTLGDLLREVKGAQYVIVSRGHFEGPDGMELLWEDGSDNPFCIHLNRNSLDRVPEPADAGRTDLTLAIWADGPTLMRSFACRYRQVDRLPALNPWPGST